jgi:hypothetical protein
MVLSPATAFGRLLDDRLDGQVRRFSGVSLHRCPLPNNRTNMFLSYTAAAASSQRQASETTSIMEHDTGRHDGANACPGCSPLLLPTTTTTTQQGINHHDALRRCNCRNYGQKIQVDDRLNHTDHFSPVTRAIIYRMPPKTTRRGSVLTTTAVSSRARGGKWVYDGIRPTMREMCRSLLLSKSTNHRGSR